MGWDSKALLVLALIWAALSLIYVTVIGMMPGARAWGAGAVIFATISLVVWYAERRGTRRIRTATKANNL